MRKIYKTQSVRKLVVEKCKVVRLIN